NGDDLSLCPQPLAADDKVVFTAQLVRHSRKRSLHGPLVFGRCEIDKCLDGKRCGKDVCDRERSDRGGNKIHSCHRVSILSRPPLTRLCRVRASRLLTIRCSSHPRRTCRLETL